MTETVICTLSKLFFARAIDMDNNGILIVNNNILKKEHRHREMLKYDSHSSLVVGRTLRGCHSSSGIFRVITTDAAGCPDKNAFEN